MYPTFNDDDYFPCVALQDYAAEGLTKEPSSCRGEAREGEDKDGSGKGLVEEDQEWRDGGGEKEERIGR